MERTVNVRTADGTDFGITMRSSAALFVRYRQDFGESLVKALQDDGGGIDPAIGLRLAYEMAVPKVRDSKSFDDFADGIPVEAVLPILRETLSMLSSMVNDGQKKD